MVIVQLLIFMLEEGRRDFLTSGTGSKSGQASPTCQ